MTIDDEVRRATKLLETVMQAAGLTRKDLDQKLGAGPGYVSQVLTGRMELKFRHILAMLRALEVAPTVYFQTLYPENRPSSDAVVMEEFLRRFQKLGFGAQPAPPPVPPLDPQELERMIQNAVRAALAGAPEKPAPSGGEGPEGEKPRKKRRPRGSGRPKK
ncbi:MAG TPA: helix-turn-helix transcriptional regulator [Thermoanaerobaculia bacterium]|jgi:transcriptional regulator with XRE-family HTH domain|nr:helix-turn-helix transcriptional regulator [Thermoanaerobaculia bacterium]